MKLDKGSLAALVCTAKEKHRYALNGLNITATEVQATDGLMLIRVKHPEQDDGHEGDAPFIPRIIDAKSIETAAKSLDSKSPCRAFGEVWIDVDASNANGHVHASVPWGNTRADVKLEPIDGTFPAVEAVTPDPGGYTAAVRLNVDRLVKLGKAIREVQKVRGLGNEDVFTLKIYGGENGKCSINPVRLESVGGEVVAVLMPIVAE